MRRAGAVRLLTKEAAVEQLYAAIQEVRGEAVGKEAMGKGCVEQVRQF
jgi:hypothetical protein